MSRFFNHRIDFNAPPTNQPTNSRIGQKNGETTPTPRAKDVVCVSAVPQLIMSVPRWFRKRLAIPSLKPQSQQSMPFHLVQKLQSMSRSGLFLTPCTSEPDIICVDGDDPAPIVNFGVSTKKTSRSMCLVIIVFSSSL